MNNSYERTLISRIHNKNKIKIKTLGNPDPVIENPDPVMENQMLYIYVNMIRILSDQSEKFMIMLNNELEIQRK